jgi:hypothetical protein
LEIEDMLKRTLVVVALVAATLVTSQLTASAGHSWSGYHWDDHDAPVGLPVVNDLTNYETEFGQAITDWNSKGPLAFNVVDGTDRPAVCDNVGTDAAGADILGTIHVCNDDYGQNGWLGLARIWLSADGHIEAGVTLMNDTYLQSGSYNDRVAWRHVMCQEIGHDVGLGHVGGPKNRSCMNDRWGLFDDRYDSPNGHDYDQLNAIYGGATSGGGGRDPKPCRGKKCGAGAHDVHVVPRPGGGSIITFSYSTGAHH